MLLCLLERRMQVSDTEDQVDLGAERRTVWEQFCQGRLDADQATARLLAINQVERQRRRERLEAGSPGASDTRRRDWSLRQPRDAVRAA